MNEKIQGPELEGCRVYIAKLLKESQVDVAVDATLQNSCGLDLKMYCSDISPGHGRRITCLVNLMKKQPTKLTEDCLSKLKERQGMWNKAQSMRVESLGDLANVVTRSHNAGNSLDVLSKNTPWPYLRVIK